MKGKYSLQVAARKVLYQLNIERKVTVIKGNSGTGKSSLVRLLLDYVELGKDSGVRIRKDSEYEIKIFENRTNWTRELENASNCIIFVDEDVRYLYEKTFQRIFQTADCYIVIVSRSGMFQQLPYAINSIYELRTQKNGKAFLTQMYQIYKQKLEEAHIQYVITEDSNAGYEMICKMFTCPVESAHGNSNVSHFLVKKLAEYASISVIVDGAAFGAYIAAVVRLAKIKNNVTIIAPESFEYLLLKTPAIQKFLDDELICTWRYCDSQVYLTWERYFTELLEKITEENYGFKYSKRKINVFFLNPINIEEIRKQLTNVVCENE